MAGEPTTGGEPSTAGEPTTGGATTFGQVSRLRGTVFRYVTLAASWIGVVALFVLLLYVLYDAMEFRTADAGWFAVYLLVVVAPGLAAAWYYYRRPTAGRVGLASLTVLFGGTATGLAVLVLFAVLDPAVWFTYAVTWLAPTGLVVAVGYGYGPVERRRARLLVLPVAITGLLAGAVATGGVDAATAVRWATTLAVAGAVGGWLVVAGTRHPDAGRVGGFALAAVALGALVGFGLLGLDHRFGLGLPGPAVVYGAADAAALVGLAGYVVTDEDLPLGAARGLAAPVLLTAAVVVGRLLGDAVAPLLSGAVAAVLSPLTALSPGAWTVYAVTLVAPVAVAAGLLARERGYVRASWSDVPESSPGWLAVPVLVLVAAVAGTLALPVLAQTVGTWLFETLTGSAWLVFLVTLVVPTGLYVGEVLTNRESGHAGLLAPAVLLAGLVVAEAAVGVLGFSGPATWLDWQFVTSGPSSTPSEAGLYLGVVGSTFLLVLVALFTFPLGVGAAVYLEEYAPESGRAGQVTKLVQVNIANLAGVPSVVYGILGLVLFVNLVGLGFGTVIVGSLTLSLLILPIVVISAQEAVRAVPDSTRQASYGMGATRWQTIRNVVLPEAMPGILTGTILALGRAIGETAPLIMIGMPHSFFGSIQGPTGKAPAMPLHIFNWAFRPETEFRHGVVAAGVVVLVVVLLTMNSVAILVRNRYERST